jgi:cytochrome c oxidase assembly protein subunit 15
MTFQRLGYVTLICLYLLVLAGGIVRSTGSGMGCPDWPKCFGQFIPPTQASELPFNYQEIYREKLHGEVAFNATKTWIEYINRLLGALTGLCMLFTTILAWKKGGKTFLFTLGAFILVFANAILGKYVVDSFLLPGVVTAHMLLTTGVLVCLLKAMNVDKEVHELTSATRNWILINGVIVFTQIIIGTQVRENMDHVIVKFGYASKNVWIENLDAIYIVHRTYSWLIMLSHLYLWRILPASHVEHRKFRKAFAMLIGFSLVSGIIMAYTSLPLGSQAVHLTTSLLLLGVHIHAWQRTKTA